MGAMERTAALLAGAATADITPAGSVFLYGYPGVERFSTGIHDRLASSALFLSDGKTSLILAANDCIYIGKATAARARRRIEEQTAVAAAQVMIAATHTHSGPVTVDVLSNEHDRVVPKADPEYLQRLEDGIVAAAVQAVRNAAPARLGFAVADGSCVGGNRHDPRGPSDPQVPVVLVRQQNAANYIALLTVCNMHPTVLHEDSRLISGDFPAATRRCLQEQVVGPDCPILYLTGPCGNQSPRHVTRGNSFAEADRLGGLLAEAIAAGMASAADGEEIRLACKTAAVELPRRKMPSVAEAESNLRSAHRRLESLRRSSVPRAEVRTAECDWFGAEECVTLARAAAAGSLDATLAAMGPAEVLAMRIGPWWFAGWPGEVYVEFGLAVKARHPHCYLISHANGELQGYLVTAEAVQARHYEAMNALLASPQSGERLVRATLELLEEEAAP